MPGAPLSGTPSLGSFLRPIDVDPGCNLLQEIFGHIGPTLGVGEGGCDWSGSSRSPDDSLPPSVLAMLALNAGPLPPSVLAILVLNAGRRAAAAARTRAVRRGSFQRSPIASTECAGEDGTNRPTPAMRLSQRVLLLEQVRFATVGLFGYSNCL